MLLGVSRSRCFFIAIALSMLSCSAPVHAQERSAVQCTPNFPFKESWWGADAAYSIPLPDGRSAWIFGDTLNGDRRVVEGNEPRMVRNSIGISTCDSRSGWKINYIIRRGDKGQPVDFFQAQHNGTWYWALDGFFYENDLWVTLLCVRSSPKTTPAAMGFETCGADLARISQLENDPQHWGVTYFPLVLDGIHAYPSATAVVEGDYVYIFWAVGSRFTADAAHSHPLGWPRRTGRAPSVSVQERQLEDGPYPGRCHACHEAWK